MKVNTLTSHQSAKFDVTRNGRNAAIARRRSAFVKAMACSYPGLEMATRKGL